MLGREARWLLGIISTLTLAISVWRELQFLGIAALAVLTLTVSPKLLQSLADRLAELPGGFKFHPNLKDVLNSVPEGVRATAEEDAEGSIQRLEDAMGNWSRFANALRAEIAALSVRMTAVEEEFAIQRAGREYKGYQITLDSEQVRDAEGRPDGWKPKARILARGSGDSFQTIPIEPRVVQIVPSKAEADAIALRIARKWIDERA